VSTDRAAPCAPSLSDPAWNAQHGFGPDCSGPNDRTRVRSGIFVARLGIRHPQVTAGYSRLHALNICAKTESQRVRWLSNRLVPDAFRNDGYALGAPTVTAGIVYVTTKYGHVLALADPSIGANAGFQCSNPDFGFTFQSNDCTENGYSVVPIPSVLADVPLPDLSDAVGLRSEPVIANGKLYVSTGGGHIYSLEPAALPPPKPFDISVTMTETQIGPDICVSGEGFTPGGTAKVSYTGIPARSSPVSAGSSAISPGGTFSLADTSQEGALDQFCSNYVIQGSVTIGAVDPASGKTATTTVPAAYWCSNAPVSTNFNGGCQ
jgi:PQQ-like domain